MHVRHAALTTSVLGLALLASTFALSQDTSEQPARPKRSFRKEYAEFLAKPADVREHLRQIDQNLHEEDSETQLRLRRLMQRYSDWLDGLAPEQRKRVESAPSTEERMARIAEVREEQWIATVPKVDRIRLADAKKVSPAAYKKAVDEVRQELRVREMEWLAAQADTFNPTEAFRRLKTQLKQKLETDADRAKLENDLQGLTPWNQLKVLVPLAEAKGLKIPPGLRKPQFPMEFMPRVEMSKLLEFLKRPENADLSKDFLNRVGDPAERHKAIAEMEKKYWEANEVERKNREEHDRRIRRGKDKP